MSSEMVAFVRARLDEEEPRKICGCIDTNHWPPCTPQPWKERKCREIAAMRAIVDGYEEALQCPYDLPAGVYDGRDDSERLRDESVLDAMQAVAGAVATIWNDHPDYRPDWKP